MGKKIVGIVSLILILVVIGGAIFFDDKVSELDFDVSEIDSYQMLLDDSFIYLQFNDYGGVNYCRYYFDNNETVKIGTIPNFYLSTKNNVLIDDVMYFYIAEYQSVDTVQNVLYSINTIDNTMSRYENIDESLIGIFTYEFNDKVVTIKNEVNDNIILTYVELFDISTEVFEKHFINAFDSVNYEGSAIHGLYGNDNYLYILTDEYEDGIGSSVTTLKEYNTDMKETRTINIDDEILYSVFNNRIKDMAVFGDYIYIINMSNNAVLGKIVNGTVEPILFESDMELIMHQDSTTEISLFKRNSNEYYTVDLSNGEITTINLNIRSGVEAGEDNAISWLMVHDDNVLLICHDKERPIDKFIYYLDKEALENSYFACGE